MGGKRLIAALLCLVCLSGCTGRSAAPALPCRVVLEEGEGFEEDVDEYTSEGIFFVPANARRAGRQRRVPFGV